MPFALFSGCTAWMLVDRGIAVFFGIARVAIQLDNYLFFRTVYEYGECICLRLGFAAAAENQLVVSADGGLQFFFYGMGEKSILEYTELIKKGVDYKKLTNI